MRNDVRDARIALAYHNREAIEIIAKRENLTPQRVTQILSKLAGRLTGSYYIGVLRATSGIEHRLRDTITPRPVVLVAETPEEFFYELLNEKRTVT